MIPGESVQAAIRAARDQAEQVLTTATAQEMTGGAAPETWQALQTAWEELRVGEEELARQGTLLEELSRREPLLSVFDRAGAAVVITDEHGRVHRATEVARRTLGAADGGFLPENLPRAAARTFREVLARAKLAPGHPAHALLPTDSGPTASGWVLCALTPAIDGEDAQAVWLVHLDTDAVDSTPPIPDVVREIAGLRVTTESLHELLSDLSQYVVAALSQADGASVTLLTPGSLGATNSAVEAADRLQYALQEGPCYDALRTGKQQSTGMAHDDARWPRLGTALTDARAFRSIAAVPLFAGTDITGVLNIYAVAPDAFDETDHRMARILAGPVAATLADARAYTEQSELVAGLRQAVDSHRRIGQAIGVMMVTDGVDSDTAFARLRKRSNETNRKLRDIAAEVVEAAAPRTPGGD